MKQIRIRLCDEASEALAVLCKRENKPANEIINTLLMAQVAKDTDNEELYTDS